MASSPFNTIYGTTITANAILDELKNGSNIVFDAGSILWGVGLTNFTSAYGLNQPAPMSVPLRQLTNNILYRMVTGTNPPTSGNSCTSPAGICLGQ